MKRRCTSRTLSRAPEQDGAYAVNNKDGADRFASQISGPDRPHFSLWSMQILNLGAPCCKLLALSSGNTKCSEALALNFVQYITDSNPVTPDGDIHIESIVEK